LVWPEGSAPITEAASANVTAQLLTPGTNESVACRYDPDEVQLFAWRHFLEQPRPVPSPPAVAPGVPAPTLPATTEQPARTEKQEPEKVLLGTGKKRFVSENGLTYPVWDFDGVDVSYARTANNERWLEMFVAVEGLKMDPQPWFYGGEKNQDWTAAHPRPSASCQ